MCSSFCCRLWLSRLLGYLSLCGHIISVCICACCSVPRGESRAIACSDRSVVVVKYADKKDVHVLTTGVNYVEVQANNKTKPLPIVEYNTYMGGVDLNDKVGSSSC